MFYSCSCRFIHVEREAIPERGWKLLEIARFIYGLLVEREAIPERGWKLTATTPMSVQIAC